jgi:putative exporter of polyketide antibiotics
MIPNRLIPPTLWLINLTRIFSLSLFGRRLQYWSANLVGYTAIAWMIGLMLLGLIVAYLYGLKPRLESLSWLHLGWSLSTNR